MAPASSTTAHADAIQAQIDVSISKAQRLVASWLPENTTTATDSDTDEDLFKPIPPRLGVGAPVPVNFNSKTNDTLRRTMLGRKPTKAMPETATRHKLGVVQADSDDDDAGRSALGCSKRKKTGNDLRKHKMAKTNSTAHLKTAKAAAVITGVKSEEDNPKPDISSALKPSRVAVETSMSPPSKKKNKKRASD